MRNDEEHRAGWRPGPARAAGPHPADDALAALLDGAGGTEPRPAGADREGAATRRHVAGCAVCTHRLAELRAVRDALAEAAAREAAPRRDLAQGAVERLRLRQGAADRLNELLLLLAGLARGLVGVLAGHGAGAPRAPRPGSPPDAAGAGVTRG